jgi:hypothetical protein
MQHLNVYKPGQPLMQSLYYQFHTNPLLNVSVTPQANVSLLLVNNTIYSIKPEQLLIVVPQMSGNTFNVSNERYAGNYTLVASTTSDPITSKQAASMLTSVNTFTDIAITSPALAPLVVDLGNYTWSFAPSRYPNAIDAKRHQRKCY